MPSGIIETLIKKHRLNDDNNIKICSIQNIFSYQNNSRPRTTFVKMITEKIENVLDTPGG